MEFIEIEKGGGDKFAPSILGGALILFFSNGCGHCTSMKPEWSNLKKKLNELQGELKGVNIVSVNSDAAGELDNEWHKYAGRVPTIIAIDKSGKKHDYNKKRKTEDFVEFMKEVLSNNQQSGGKKKRERKKSNRKKSNRKKSYRKKSNRKKSYRKKSYRKKSNRKKSRKSQKKK